jgi:heme-degrading monooxygenase HmoA
MHAVVIRVTINDEESATAQLREQVVPRVSQAPGFVSGYWTRSAENNRGLSMIVFESQEAAEGAKQAIDSEGLPNDAVTIDSVEVREVVASA